MFGFLGFLLILFLLIIFIGFSILGSILSLFGLGKYTFHYQSHTYTREKTNDEEGDFAETSSSSSHKHPHSTGGRKKIFTDDEGEYVDFEEVK